MIKIFIPLTKLIVMSVIVASTAASTIVFAQTNSADNLPHLFDAQERLNRPDVSDIKRLRFVTTVDFPPFNFIDQTGRLSGYNIDLIKAICSELDVEQSCQIEALPWNELVGSLEQGQSDAIITGMKNSPELNPILSFSDAYLRFPARFIALQKSVIKEPISANIDGLTTGVLKNTLHEKLFMSYFPKARLQSFSSALALYDALKTNKIDLAFGDGMQFSVFLNSEASKDCCNFVGGAYTAPLIANNSMRIALRKDDGKLRTALNYALKSLERKGKLSELYLRYFPIGLVLLNWFLIKCPAVKIANQ